MHEMNRRSFLASLGLGLLGAATLPAKTAQAETTGPCVKIHFVVPDGTWRNQDAIIIEIVDEDGEKTFGLIDGGFGPTWATDDPSYANRYKENNKYNPETLKDCYLKTLDYLETLDINSDNVAFYIGTHAHSDHIGIAKELIEEYRPKVVYSPEYDDEYIQGSYQIFTNTDGEIMNSYNLSDNQYYYDRLVDAAKEIDVPLVLNIDPDGDDPSLDSDTAKPTFEVAGVEFEIMNWDPYYKELDGPERIENINEISWGLKMTAHGTVSFLAADINNNNGAEDVLAEEIGKVDFLKLGHHGSSGSSTYNFLATLNPDLVVQTGACSNGTVEKIGTLDTVCQARWFATQDGEVLDLPAIIITIDENGEMTTNVDGLWMPRYTAVGSVLYEDGRPASDGWHHVNDKWYWTDGPVFSVGWVEIDGMDYHFEADGSLTMGLQTLPDGTQRYMMDDGHWAPPGYMGPGTEGGLAAGGMGSGGFFGFGNDMGAGGPGLPFDPDSEDNPFEPGFSEEGDDVEHPDYDDPEETRAKYRKKQALNAWDNLGPEVEEPIVIQKIIEQGFDLR